MKIVVRGPYHPKRFSWREISDIPEISGGLGLKTYVLDRYYTLNL